MNSVAVTSKSDGMNRASRDQTLELICSTVEKVLRTMLPADEHTIRDILIQDILEETRNRLTVRLFVD